MFIYFSSATNWIKSASNTHPLLSIKIQIYFRIPHTKNPRSLWQRLPKAWSITLNLEWTTCQPRWPMPDLKPGYETPTDTLPTLRINMWPKISLKVQLQSQRWCAPNKKCLIFLYSLLHAIYLYFILQV